MVAPALLLLELPGTRWSAMGQLWFLRLAAQFLRAYPAG
jgi:hypothetical protein